MPGAQPLSIRESPRHGRFPRKFAILRPLSVLPVMALLSVKPALALTLAQTNAATGLLSGIFSSGEIILLAVFGGAMSFAMMAASWLILERGRITEENSELKARVAGSARRQQRAEALVSVSRSAHRGVERNG